MKLGIAGTGKIVQEALPVILRTMDRPEDRIVLMGRAHSAERTRQLCSQYALDGYVLDFDALLSSGVDTVYIALPNHLHAEYALQALRAGKHVILEKPAALRYRELEEVLAAAKEEHRILVEAMSLHYLPAWQSLKEKLPEIGDIRLVNFQFCQYSSRYDAFQRGEIAPAFDPACGGGALMDLGVYNLHAIVSLFGVPSSARYHARYERGVDTGGVLLLDYGDFQALSIAAKDCQAPVSSTIQGTKGCLRISVPANQINGYELWRNGQESERFDFAGGTHRLAYEFRTFRRVIEEEDAAFAQRMARISLDVLRVTDMARGAVKSDIV